MLEGLENLMVVDLYDSSQGCWNTRLVDKNLDDYDAQAIFRTPVYPYLEEDKLIWVAAKDGRFSIKSAYNLIMQKTLQYEDCKIEGDWNLIWRVKIPPRVKTLLWRLYTYKV